MKAYKFKIKRPNQKIVQRFEQTLELCRELYNSALRERIDAYKINKCSITYRNQQNQLPEIKAIRDDLNSVYSQVLQDALKRLDKTFKAFFQRLKSGEKAGFPRFKGHNRYDSFTYPQASGCFRLEGNNLFLSKIGKVKIHLSQNVLGKVKTCTIKKEIDSWFVIFTVETENVLLEKTGQFIGMDAGIESFMTLSNGEQIPNFKYYEKAQKELRRKQRSVSRKKKGSQLRKDAVIQLKKIHAKIKNQRNDFAHKLSTKLVREFDVIAIERLNILGMSKGILSKQIYDVAWNSFFQKLKYKAENAGKSVIEVNPNGTSQTCLCGEPVKKDLSVRQHHCVHCGYSNHRDIVSAKIILNRALGQNAENKSVPSNRGSVETITWAVTSCVVSESPIKTL